MTSDETTIRQRRDSRWSIWGKVALAGYALAYLALGVSLLINKYTHESDFAGAVLGACISLSGVAAVWASWGTSALWKRLGLSAGAIGISSLLVCLLLPNVSMPPEPRVLVFIGMPVAVFAVGLLPLLGSRLVWGLRIAKNDETEISTEGIYQFGIRQLLIATAIVAVLFGIGRATLSDTQLRNPSPIGVAFAIKIGFIFSTCSTVAAWLAILLGLAVRQWFWVIPILAILVGVGVAEYQLLMRYVPGPTKSDAIMILVQWHVAQSIAIIWPLLALRALGMRLARNLS